MSVPLAGYVTHRALRSSGRARAYVAERKRDQTRVFAKVFEPGDEPRAARIEHAVERLAEFDDEGIVRPLGVERAGHALVVLFEYVDGLDLDAATGGRPLEIERFCRWAISMAEILGRVHARRIVHRELKPSNMLIEGEGDDERVRFADFGLSTALDDDRGLALTPEQLVANLRYVSPERTGRTKAQVDSRSDLYSLGAMYYELLTGRPPFSATSPLELIHAHLAQQPKPPHELTPSVPTQLSAIVMKLLAKAPEHRYQSAQGLRADLQRFVSEREAGRAQPQFELALDDRPLVLQLPHGLYGRTQQLELLARELDAAVADSSRRTVIVSGGLGSGKSALLSSVAAPASRHGGYVALAQFDEHGHDTPYAALIAAVRGLLAQLLGESDEQLEQWRTQLLDALGSLAGLIAGLIPEFALIVGVRPGVPELPPTESQNRLQLAFARLLRGLCQVAPLVFAIDDVQWADEASVELLTTLARERGGPALLLLGCRSDLPNNRAATAVLELAARLADEGRACSRLELEPLERESVVQLLVDTLARTPEQVTPLAEYLGRKTDSSPQALRALLLHLFDVELLQPSAEGWNWDLDAIIRVPLPADLLEVVTAKLGDLTPEQLAVLELAACAGERFDPAVLVIELEHDGHPAGANGRSPAELFAILHTLEDCGFLDAFGSRLHFAHPRLRAAVYTRIEPFRRKQIHTALGRRMLARFEDANDAAGEHLFWIVDQLVAGLDDDDDDDDGEPSRQQRELARLATRAGELALEGAAWGTARRYFRRAVELLRRERVGDSLRFRAHFGHAQSLQLDHQFELADRAFETLLAEPLAPLEQAKVIARRLQVLAHTGQTQRAVELGLHGLRRCGLEVGDPRPLPELSRELLEVASNITLERLLALPEVQDERVLAIFDLLDALNTLTFTVDRGTFLHLALEHLKLCFSHGRHPSVLSVLHNVGFALLGGGNFEVARRICETALALAHGSADAEQRVAARAWMLFVGPCFRPFAEFARAIVDSHRQATELGDVDDASSKGAIGLIIQLEAGVHLREVRANFRRFHAAHERWGSANMLGVAGSVRWLLEQFSGEPLGERSSRLPTIADWDDAEMALLIRYGAVINKVWAAVLLGEHEWAWDEAQRIAADYEDAVFGSWAGPRFGMLDAILVSDRLSDAPAGEPREQLLARLQQRRDSLARWAARGPDNYQPYLDIVDGELARARGEINEAVRRFESARQHAGERGRAYVEGLACLRVAALGESLEWPSMAEGGLRGARRVFERWGAWALVQRIDERLGERVDAHDATPEQPSQAASAPALPSLDLAAVLDTVQSISEDLRLEEVITRVLHSAIESAGADRGLLLLERDGELAVVAEGRAGRTTAFLGQAFPLALARSQLPTSIVHYVLRTGAAIVVDDALADPRFANDPYVQRAKLRSLLGMSIVKQNSRLGVLVLENRLHAGTFTEARLETARILLAQAASSIDNARLYAELARNEAQWRSLVDGAPDVITLLDEQGRIEFVNHLAPLTIDPRSLIGEPGDKLLEPRSAAAWRQALSEVAGTGGRRELELCVAPDGAAPRWMMTRLAAIRVDGKLSRVLSIATDITERKNLETQLRQQQRLESLGTLAAGVAHEINNPVQGILNYAELISDRATDPETVREFAEEISTESQRVAMIVRHLLVFGRQDAERNLEPVDPHKLIEGTLALIGAVIRKDNIELELALDPRPATLRCRPQQIQQIVMNLVTNARDALNERYTGYHPDKRIRIASVPFTRDEESWLRISVEDRGSGIPADVLAHIFDPFFTTKGRDQGTGLGLSVSHGIATEHGGELRVESERGIGTRMSLELPGLMLS